MYEKIDWNEFKQWKDYQSNEKKELGNLYLLISFLINQQNIVSTSEIFDIISSDTIGATLFERNEISTPNDIIKFMKNKN